MSAESQMERLVKPTRIYARAALTQAGETLSHTEPMSTKLDDAFATLRNLITDQTRDLAMAMAELRSVAQQRDKALTERDAARAGYSAMNTRIYGPGGECFELDKARAERDKLSDALQRNCVQYVEKQQALIAERDNARQSLRAAEQDVAETESVNSDLRAATARLVADLAAAMERADTAEAILRAKA